MVCGNTSPFCINPLHTNIRNKIPPFRFTLLEVALDRDKANEFEQLAMPLFASLYNLAQWLTQDRSEAEDLVQETYAKALKGFGSFQPGTNFRAWMYRILRNTFLTSRTGLKAAKTVSLDDEEDPQSVSPVTAETPESTCWRAPIMMRFRPRCSSCRWLIARSSCCVMWRR